jgi:hypothetical protein
MKLTTSLRMDGMAMTLRRPDLPKSEYRSWYIIQSRPNCACALLFFWDRAECRVTRKKAPRNGFSFNSAHPLDILLYR